MAPANRRTGIVCQLKLYEYKYITSKSFFCAWRMVEHVQAHWALKSGKYRNKNKGVGEDDTRWSVVWKCTSFSLDEDAMKCVKAKACWARPDVLPWHEPSKTSSWFLSATPPSTPPCVSSGTRDTSISWLLSLIKKKNKLLSPSGTSTMGCRG